MPKALAAKIGLYSLIREKICAGQMHDVRDPRKVICKQRFSCLHRGNTAPHLPSLQGRYRGGRIRQTLHQATPNR